MRPTSIILAIVLALGTVEGLAWWWMNPPPADIGEPVLAYRPQVKAEKLNAVGAAATSGMAQPSRHGVSDSEGKTEMLKEEAPSPAHVPAPGTSSTDHCSLLTDHSISPSQHFSVPAFQLLPDIYRQAAPMLRCTSGQVFHVKIHETAGLHGAFFEWDGTDTGSVLEAFRHMPEACMGAIGMKLVSKEKPILYVVRGQESGDRGQDHDGTEIVDRGSKIADDPAAAPSPNQQLVPAKPCEDGSKINTHQSSISPSSTDNRQPTTDNSPTISSTAHRSPLTDHSSSASIPNPSFPSSNQQSTIVNPQSSISSSPTAHRSLLTAHSSPISASQHFSVSASNATLIFDHTVFRDPGQGGNALVPGPLVHAFRAVWVSGSSATDARKGLDGRQFDQLRSIRLMTAVNRYRPRHARVIQGAVRGFHTPEAAWAAFEEHMLRNLSFEQ